MAMAPEQVGIGIRRHFTRAGEHPYESVAWERRDARIPNYKSGGDAFFQPGVEFPAPWSQNATNIVAQKYFRGQLGTPEREWSLRQVIDRVADTISDWGVRDGYFVDAEESDAFRDELKYLLLHQRAAFNSPVWFNIGVKGVPAQASACQPYDALVSTPDGFVPIGRLVEENAVGTKVFDAHGLTKIVAVKANGTKGVLRVHTKAGYTLDVTADHLVWRVSGEGTGRFVPAGELKPGNRLQWHRTESWGAGTMESVDIAEAALAGWLQSDGFVGQYDGTNRSLTIEAMTVTPAEHEWVGAAIDKVFPDAHRHERSVLTQDESLDCRRIRLYGWLLDDFVTRWGLRARGVEMEVPAHLFTAPLPVVAAYLRSVFQADGYVSLRERAAVVGLDMISERLVRGIQQLLLRFGIFSRVRFKGDARPDRKGCWTLSVRPVCERRRFADEVGFVDAKKADKLEESLELPGLSSKDTKELQVERVEALGAMEVYDIQTESGEYLSGNLRVHNCFILAVEDTMSSILNWYTEEGTIFKGGSGSGINLSIIRSSLEPLGGGGTASGPVSFMRGADASAGTIKCLHADTALTTDHGVVPIQGVAPGWRVLTRHGFRTVSAVHDNGVRPLVRVRTALGDEIVCTPEHRFRVRGRDGETWREAGELGVDDYVVVDLGHTDHGQVQRLVAEESSEAVEVSFPSVLDEAFAVWLGWAHGEGRLRPVSGSGALAVHLDAEDRGLAERYRAFSQSVFGREMATTVARGGEAAPASVCPPRVARFLQANGLWRNGASGIPRLVHSSPAAVRAAFLAGLFESDGHVQHGCPTLWSRRRGLALDVHRLLLSIGIPSKVSQARPPVGNGAQAGESDDSAGAVPTSGPGLWRVRVVGGEGVRRFAKLVGFVSESKARLLEGALERPDAFEPSWFFPHVDAELDRLGFPAGAALRGAISSYRQDAHPYGMSLARATSVLSAFGAELDGPLVRFAQGDELYVPVTVEPAGDGPTFDLTVEGVHEYLVHGVVTHNSGGKTRRAAKMVILNADHPDVEQFIWCKAVEERKARALAAAGFDMDLDGIDSHSVQYQNANNSVRVSDDFMEAVLNDRDWNLRAVTTGETLKTLRARAVLRQISEAAWECADPGMQFDTTINRWHTAPNAGRINASNPCSEYMHLDNSACNLASLNLLTFLRDDGSFDVEGFKAAVEVIFTAQEILVGNADYPTKKIAENSRRFRQLGIGYANLGALLMAQGLPYDSDEGRAWAGALTAVMTGHAYATSARTAGRMGPFAGFGKNRDATLEVLRMHRAEVDGIDANFVPAEVLDAARAAWDEAVELGEAYGVRNSQASVLAPTGTIGLMMDCDTTGVEPDLALTKAKKLVGGGTMFIVNQTVPRALRRLGYSDAQVEAIIAYIDEHKTILGAPGLRVDHLPVFACAMGDNTIHYMGHVKMMAAVQPFISGAISKCVVGETLVSTADGLVRIGDLHRGEAPDSFRDEVLEVASLGGNRKTDAFYYGGVRPVREVTLRSGHRVVGTPNHRLLVGDRDGLAWRRLDEIGCGEQVALRYGAELWSALPGRLPVAAGALGMPEDMSEELAFLLGAFAACGRLSAGAVTISHPFRPLLERLAGVWRSVVGVDARVSRPGTRRPSVTVTSKSALAFLEALGAGERIPAAVLASPREMVLAYLEGLFLAARPSRSGGALTLTVDLPAGGLVADTHAVLTNLGVLHTAAGGTIELRAAAARGLLDLVPLADPRAAGLAAEATRIRDLPAAESDFIPGLSPRELYLLIPPEDRGDFIFLRDPKSRHVSRRTLERVAGLAGVALPDWLETVVADGLHFSPVEAVSDAGEREVFDLSVPLVHAFVANGIVNHNTINMPEEATVEDVEDLHIEAWRLGLKAIAIYRDNCKVGQPLSTQKKAGGAGVSPGIAGGAGVSPGIAGGAGVSPGIAGGAGVSPEIAGDNDAPVVERIVETIVLQEPVRQKLPRKRNSKTYSFRVADCHGYVTVGEFEDGRPGEIFLKVAKQGSTLAGIMDAFAISVSHGLQYGVPLKAFVDMFTNMRFEPAGITDDPDIRLASSLVDYIFRRLAVEYLSYEERVDLGIMTVGERSQPTLPGVEEAAAPPERSVDLAPASPDLSLDLRPPGRSTPPAAPGPRAAAVPEGSRRIDAPYCYACGMEMQRAGSCYVCSSCGATSGCS